MQRILAIVVFCCSFGVSADDTVLKLYRPYGDVLDQASLSVKEQVVGHCDTQSRLIVREDAWRCQVEAKVFDPCFVHTGVKMTAVLCPQSPWVGDSVRIVVNAPLDGHQHQRLDMSRALPWAVELVNGERCQAVDSSETFDGMPVRYRCSGTNVLLGYLQRCKATWSMLQKTPYGVSSVNFKKVWF